MIKFLETNYPKVKEHSISGRWIRVQDIEPLLNNLPDFINVEKIGVSEEKRPIYHLKLGNGSKKILIWTQMHGNESTGTKALFDFLNFLDKFKDTEIVQEILKNTSIEIIPILNPDGAQNYSRLNANEVDLNRDAVNRIAIESNILRDVLSKFNPQFCFNLHDQRTIFGVEGTQNPATISFLAPSEDKNRTLTKGRIETMNVIVAMNTLLQELIPNQIGRYTDEFYPTATGDNFQKLGHNTILIEAGHYKNDYKREVVRKYNFYALLKGVSHIATINDFSSYKKYYDIPNNIKNFVDVIHRGEGMNTGYQYIEGILDNTFVLKLSKLEKIEEYTKGHKEILEN